MFTKYLDYKFCFLGLQSKKLHKIFYDTFTTLCVHKVKKDVYYSQKPLKNILKILSKYFYL